MTTLPTNTGHTTFVQSVILADFLLLSRLLLIILMRILLLPLFLNFQFLEPYEKTPNPQSLALVVKGLGVGWNF